jgi:Penicillin binding protein transpeptidase domain
VAITTEPARATSPRVPPSQGMGGGLTLAFVIVVFAILATIVYVNNGNPEIRRIDLVAQQYADAWSHGSLADIEYDKLSGPDVEEGDPDKIADNVRWIVHDLDGKGDIRPTKVEVDKAATHRADDVTLATTRLLVTWELARAGLSQKGHVWQYVVTLQERLDRGRWRVVWTPQTVHPAIRHGLVFRVQRALAPRAPLIGAGDTSLPPDNRPDLGRAVLGSIATQANHEQAELHPLRSAAKDAVGVAGLQDLYDDRLAGGAQVTVTAQPAQGYTGLRSTQNPLFVGAPETPTPIQLTLDQRTQIWAETALKNIRGPATLVVTKLSTADLLAVANTPQTTEYGLASQAPPGSLFGLTTYLALAQKGFTLTSTVDCRQPFTFPGQGQMFRNSQGPTIDQVRLGAAVEGGCTTGLARLSETITPEELQGAAWDLGSATPLRPADRTPGWLAVADQLGTPGYFGRVNSDSDTDDVSRVDPVHHAENLVGEGRVLASPLSVTRATMTVATGQRRAIRLITNPAPQQPDEVKALDPDDARELQEIMAKAVTEGGGSAHALASLAGSPVSAMAATAGYGTGRSDTRAAWVTGFRGDYAFTVFLPQARTSDGASQALRAASQFLSYIP